MNTSERGRGRGNCSKHKYSPEIILKEFKCGGREGKIILKINQISKIMFNISITWLITEKFGIYACI